MWRVASTRGTAYCFNTFGTKARRQLTSVGFTMADVVGFPEWASDGYLFQRLRRLGDSRLARPFVVLSSETALMRDTEVRLTPDGKAALDGREHFVQLNGIDEHVAGVHLSSSGGDVWYRAGETLVRPVT